MDKISKYLVGKVPDDFNGKITLLLVAKPIINLTWDAFIKKFPTKDAVYEYENH